MTADANEIAAITRTIDDYFKGMHHSDRALIERAFHPDAVIAGNFDGKYRRRTRDGFAEFVSTVPPPAQNGVPYDMAIVNIDLAGDAAVVKVRDLYLNRYFVDYLTLLKFDGAWRIINKSYSHEPPLK
ncbi:MAG: nuclear transport factor 2 family protein [Alphaproteobacteria bacterium]|nr:nuclear transport factor 2 family protein [Alphaproteobacteria bacterium]